MASAVGRMGEAFLRAVISSSWDEARKRVDASPPFLSRIGEKKEEG
jgi:hypothetical protein